MYLSFVLVLEIPRFVPAEDFLTASHMKNRSMAGCSQGGNVHSDTMNQKSSEQQQQAQEGKE